MHIKDILIGLSQDSTNPQLKKALAEAFKVESLILRFHFKTPYYCTFLWQGFDSLVNTTLTSLDIACNNIGNEGAKAIALWLRASSSLTYLSLGANNIHAEGIHVLAQSLAANKKLTELILYANPIREGALSLAMALESNSTLEVLRLFNTEINDNEILAILTSLKKNSTLTSLDLGMNRLTNEGAESIANSLEENTKLTYINLSYQKMTAIGINTLINCLTKNFFLKEFILLAYIDSKELAVIDNYLFSTTNRCIAAKEILVKSFMTGSPAIRSTLSTLFENHALKAHNRAYALGSTLNSNKLPPEIALLIANYDSVYNESLLSSFKLYQKKDRAIQLEGNIPHKKRQYQ